MAELLRGFCLDGGLAVCSGVDDCGLGVLFVIRWLGLSCCDFVWGGII